MKLELKIKLLLFMLLGVINLNAQSNDISIKNLIEQAFKQSQQLKIKQAEREQYTVNKKMAYSTYLPTLSFESTYTLLNSDINLPSDFNTLLMGTQALLIKEQAGIPFNTPLDANMLAMLAQNGVTLKNIPPIQERNIFKANLSTQMVLFSGFKAPLAIKASNELIKMTDLLSEQEKSSIIKDVVSSYERMAVVSVSEDVISNTESYLIEQEKFVNKALANGLATDLDLQRINLAKEKLKEKQIELSSARKLLAARLSQLSGLPANELENIKPTLELFAYTDSVFSVNNRSDLQAIDHAISASDLNQKIQYTDYIPKVFAFGKKELITDDLSAFDPQWYVGVGLRWNIFDHFTAHQNAQKAKLDELILEDKKSEAVDLLNLGMQRAKFNLEKNQQLAEVASKEVEFAEKSYRLSLKEYQNGLIPVQTHLESINELENAKLNNIQAIYEQRMSVVEIYNITGNLIQAAEKVLGINTEN